jgi:hypothetical protein
MQVVLPATRLPLTADGAANGRVQVSALDRVFLRARGFLTRTGAKPASQEVEVARLEGTTALYLRFLNFNVDTGLFIPVHLSFDDCSAFKTADKAALWFPEQLVSVDPANVKPMF